MGCIEGENMLKNMLLAAAALLPATALAAPAGVSLKQNNAITVFHGTPAKQALSVWKEPKGKTKIFSTLGKKNAYDPSSGWTIANPGSEAGSLQWFAYAITPKADGSITQIIEAIGYVTGFEGVTIALLADDNGSPGKVIQQKLVTKLETFGDCCTVAVDAIKAGIPVKAGTTYWVAATLPSKKEATTWDAWNFSTSNTGSGPAAYYTSSGWNVADETYTAFAVYGK
jgi:hypothetical protein